VTLPQGQDVFSCWQTELSEARQSSYPTRYVGQPGTSQSFVGRFRQYSKRKLGETYSKK
jgi:hypothetical protein